MNKEPDLDRHDQREPLMTQVPNLLLVYRDNDKREMLIRCLTEAGLTQLAVVDNGTQAVQFLTRQSIQLIISDIDIDDLDGWRLTRLVRSGVMQADANTPVVIISTTFSERIAEATAKEFEVNRFLAFENYTTLPEVIRSQLQGTITPPRTRLLVIEDFEDTINIVRHVLASRFDIDSARDGEQGLALWKQKRHDIVLCDLMLPKLSGEDVLREIMRERPTQSVIMMTAHAGAERAGQLLLAGAIDFLPKPFRTDQLRQICSIAAHREDYMVSNQQFLERQQQLSQEQERALVTLESIDDAVITTDAHGHVQYLNPVAEKLTGWTTEEARYKPLRDVFQTYHEVSRIPATNPLERCLQESRAIKAKTNILLRNRFAQELIIEHSAAPIRDSNQNVSGAVMVFRDSTEQRKLARELSYHASHDALTGLRNREMFDNDLRNAWSETLERGAEHSLCHLDLSKFKMINDSCGHSAGDKLLQEMAALLRQQVRIPSDTLARLGGDEFGILLRNCPVHVARRIADDIIHAVTSFEFSWQGQVYRIGISIGLASINIDCADIQDAMSSVETACRLAKERGGSRVHVYTPDDSELAQRRSEMRLITTLVNAERDNHFELFCQKIEPTAVGRKSSYEMLIRLRGEDGSMISPGQFLGAAERYNLMPQIDRWVIRNTLQSLTENPALLESVEHIAINLSALSLTDDGCYDFIAGAFRSTGIDPSKICFEITETAAIGNFVRAGGFIAAIQHLGCKFALDDFGSGMSSFAYLKRLPVDFLKIDGMFVRGILDDPIDFEMVRSINEIGHVLNLKTVAEFVENGDILEAIRTLGVDYAQGYHIAIPMPFSNLINNRLAANGAA